MFSLTAKILSTNSATLLTAKALQAALIFAALFNAGASYGQDQANKLDSAAVGQPSSTKEAIVEGNIDNDLVGEQIVANEQTVADEQEREQQELELRDAIEAVEVESGPFDQSLKEPLEDLAELLTAAGEHSEALQLYGRLLHINRINQGLYDDSQFELIEKVIAGNLAVQDWAALNDSHDYYYFLSQRTRADNDNQRLVDLNRHINWKLTYYGLDKKQNKSRQLNELKDLADEAIELTETLNVDDKITQANNYYRRAMVHYYFVVAIDRSQDTGRELSRLRSAAASSLNSNYIPNNLETMPQMRSQFVKAESFLDDVQALFDGEDEKQQLAMATIYLGDWYLLRDRRANAIDAYQEAFATFKASGLDVATINALFNRPAALPVVNPSFSIDELKVEIAGELESKATDGDEAVEKPVQLPTYYAWSDTLPSVQFPFVSEIDDALVSQEHFVDVEFTVAVQGKKLSTRDPYNSSFQHVREGRGNLRDVDIVSAETSKEKTRWEGKDDIDLLMFRPRLVDGEPVESRARMRYIFAYDE